MKLPILLILLSVLLSTCYAAPLATPASVPAPKCKLVVRFELYPPQAFFDENQQWQGMDVDFAKALLNQAGCEYQFVKTPWGRGMAMLEKGEIDMMLSVSKYPEREKFAWFIGPQRQESIVLVSSASNPITADILYQPRRWGEPVAIQQGAYYGDKFAMMMANDTRLNNHFIVIPDNNTKLTLLNKGRVRGVLDENWNIHYQIKHNPMFNDIKVHSVEVHRNPVYFALSRASVTPQLVAKLNKALAVLQSNGTFTAIMDKYELAF
ncbi:MAG: polar amino acid transport system substrate-binding protein [Phenylobacterium sp.]|jgi:polar amino acid transport system substrate-binding protein